LQEQRAGVPLSDPSTRLFVSPDAGDSGDGDDDDDADMEDDAASAEEPPAAASRQPQPAAVAKAASATPKAAPGTTPKPATPAPAKRPTPAKPAAAAASVRRCSTVVRKLAEIRISHAVRALGFNDVPVGSRQSAHGRRRKRASPRSRALKSTRSMPSWPARR